MDYFGAAAGAKSDCGPFFAHKDVYLRDVWDYRRCPRGMSECARAYPFYNMEETI